MNLPRSGQIRKAFRTTFRELKLALKEVNQRAPKLMQRGNYTGAQELMCQGQKIHAFLVEAQALQKRLVDLRAGGSGQKLGKDDTHPLWEYYESILKALVALGGEATRPQIETKFEDLFSSWLRPGDQAKMSGGRPRWRVMIERSRKHLQKEGFIESANLLRWRITESGRKAATQTGGTPPTS